MEGQYIGSMDDAFQASNAKSGGWLHYYCHCAQAVLAAIWLQLQCIAIATV